MASDRIRRLKLMRDLYYARGMDEAAKRVEARIEELSSPQQEDENSARDKAKQGE